MIEEPQANWTDNQWDEFILKEEPASFTAQCIKLRRAIADFKSELKKVPPYIWIKNGLDRWAERKKK